MVLSFIGVFHCELEHSFAKNWHQHDSKPSVVIRSHCTSDWQIPPRRFHFLPGPSICCSTLLRASQSTRATSALSKRPWRAFSLQAMVKQHSQPVGVILHDLWNNQPKHAKTHRLYIYIYLCIYIYTVYEHSIIHSNIQIECLTMPPPFLWHSGWFMEWESTKLAGTACENSPEPNVVMLGGAPN